MVGHQHRHRVAHGMSLQDRTVFCIAGRRYKHAGGIQAGARRGRGLRMAGMGKIGADGQCDRDRVDIERSAAMAGNKHGLFAVMQVLLGIFGHLPVRQEGNGADIQCTVDSQGRTGHDDHPAALRQCRQRRQARIISAQRRGSGNFGLVTGQGQFGKQRQPHAKRRSLAGKRRVACDVGGDIALDGKGLDGRDQRQVRRHRTPT